MHTSFVMKVSLDTTRLTRCRLNPPCHRKVIAGGINAEDAENAECRRDQEMLNKEYKIQNEERKIVSFLIPHSIFLILYFLHLLCGSLRSQRPLRLNFAGFRCKMSGRHNPTHPIILRVPNIQHPLSVDRDAMWSIQPGVTGGASISPEASCPGT